MNSASTRAVAEYAIVLAVIQIGAYALGFRPVSIAATVAVLAGLVAYVAIHHSGPETATGCEDVE